MLDILAKSTDKAAVLETFLAGSSPDDVAAIRKMLANGQLLTGKKGPKPDEELASDWRKGGYANKDLSNIGTLDNLLVGRAHVVFERGEQPGGVALI